MHKTDPRLAPIESNFLSIERDLYLILHKLFEENPNVAEALKRLLVINNKMCIDKTGDKYTINASSIMGVIYSLEWNNLFLVTTEDAYSLLKDYIVEATTRD